MKRELFENVKVIPAGAGAVIERTGFLSAVLGINAPADGKLEIRVEHSDTEDGEFVALDDPFAGVTGEIKDIDVGAGTVTNICIDLIGCKNYVKISVEGGETGASCAVALGDPVAAPV